MADDNQWRVSTEGHLRLMRIMADNGNEQISRDIVKAMEGRYIGGVRDTSAPTDSLIHVFITKMYVGSVLKSHTARLLISVDLFDANRSKHAGTACNL
jgi:hypothetical protein